MFLNTPLPPVTDLDVKQLFGLQSQKKYQEYTQKAVHYITEFLNNDTFYSGETSLNLRAKKDLIQVKSDHTLSIDEALKEIKELYLDHAISFHNPNYVAHLNCPVLVSSLVGDLIASSVNTAVETWDQSTSATLIEQEIIRWISDLMQFPSTSEGVFTSGGTQSNFMGLLMARDHYAYTHFGINIKQHGWSDVVSQFRIFCSEKAHFSIQKNAALLGLGFDAVIPVRTDNKMKMEPKYLALAIEKEKQKGNIPIAVVATMGTTDFGSFDPLNAINKIAKEADVWLHIDGAYGGCYALTETHKELLMETGCADSITIDFHKTLFQPVCSSVFIAKNKTHFQYISYYADYLNPIESRDEEQPNLIEKSIQTTRRFDALKLWFTLKMTGEKKIASFLEKVHYLALELYTELNNDSLFELVHKPELSTLVFRYKSEGITDDRIHDNTNLYIKNSLFKTGQASIASTKIDGKVYLKFTLLNPILTIDDLMKIIKMIKDQGTSYKINN